MYIYYKFIMRIINILGLINFFYLGYFFNFKLAYIVFFNGILFHTNENNNFLKIYDLFINILIGLYLCYNYNFIILKSLFILLSYTLNNYFYKNKYYSRFFSDIFHVLFTIYPSSYCFYLITIQNN